MSRVIFTGRDTPDTPAANKIQLYAKTDGKLYYMADDGVEIDLGTGGVSITLPLGITDGGTGETNAADALVALGGVPIDSFAALGDLLVGTGAGTTVTLSAGTNGQILSANDAEPSGLEWIDAPSAASIPIPTTNGQVLTADDTAPDGYAWSDLDVPAHSSLTDLSWAASGHTAPSAAVAGFDGAGTAIAVAPSSGYLVLTSKNGFLSWAPYALGLAFSTLTGPGTPSPAINTPVVISTGTFT
jgi:hypothetical protein